MPTITHKELISSKYAESAQTTQYTAVNCTTIIDTFSATNNGGSNVQFSVNLVSSGGSALNANRILSTKTIVPGEEYSCPILIGQTLDPGSFISTLSDTASALTIRSSGREITS
jgi:hypothetical protein